MVQLIGFRCGKCPKETVQGDGFRKALELAFSDFRRSKEINDACFPCLKVDNFRGGLGGQLVRILYVFCFFCFGWCLGFVLWQSGGQMDLGKVETSVQTGKGPQRKYLINWWVDRGVLKDKEKMTNLGKNSLFWRQSNIFMFIRITV